MINVTHLNDKRPEMGKNVLVVSYQSETRKAHLVDKAESGFEDDDFDGYKTIWYDEDYDEYYNPNEYPYWTEDEFNIPATSRRVEEVNSVKADFEIPGYKIVGGVVVKA